MKGKLFYSKLFNTLFTLLYFVALFIWLIWYIFLGEDVELNTLQEYIAFNGFSLVFYFAIFLLVHRNPSRIVKGIIALSSVGLLPLLVVGYVGAKSVITPDQGLVTARLIALVIHMFILLFIVFKLLIVRKSIV